MNKIVKNELLFQKANKRVTSSISKLTPNDFPADMVVDIVCECANKACQERISLEHEDYTTDTKAPNSFTVKPEHYLPEFENILRKTPTYWVIEKKPDKANKPFEV
jgi:hypothetical protein